MKVTLKFHESTKPALNAWWRTLSNDASTRNSLFDDFIEAMRIHLEKYQGIPPEAVRTVIDDEVCYWWKYTRQIKVRYRLFTSHPKSRGLSAIGRWFVNLFKPKSLKIVVLEIRVS